MRGPVAPINDSVTPPVTSIMKTTQGAEEAESRGVRRSPFQEIEQMSGREGSRMGMREAESMEWARGSWRGWQEQQVEDLGGPQ